MEAWRDPTIAIGWNEEMRLPHFSVNFTKSEDLRFMAFRTITLDWNDELKET